MSIYIYIALYWILYKNNKTTSETITELITEFISYWQYIFQYTKKINNQKLVMIFLFKWFLKILLRKMKKKNVHNLV